MIRTFVQAYLDGEIDIDKIDEFVEYWHIHDTGNSLHDFLGMTEKQYNAWAFTSNDKLDEILSESEQDIPEEVEIPICKVCGKKMGVKTALGIIMRSCYLGTDTCHECQVEYCLRTDCKMCSIGRENDCIHWNLKQCYMYD